MNEIAALSKFLQKCFEWGILVLAFVVPMVFMPGFNDVYFLPKLVTLVLGVLILMVLWLSSQILLNEVRWTKTPVVTPLIFLAGVIIASTLMQSPNVAEALSGKAGFIIAGILFSYMVSTRGRLLRERVLWMLVVGVTLAAGVKLLHLAGLFETLKIWPEMLKSKLWSPTGSLISFEIVQICSLAVVWGLVAVTKGWKKLILFIALLILAVGVVMVGWQLLPGKETTPMLLPYSAGYAITVEILKDIKTALLGVGVDNYISAFTRFKPVEINLTNAWNVRFLASSSEILSVVTTMGILGLLGIIFMSIKVLRVTSASSASNLQKEMGVALALILGVMLLLPVGIETWFLLFLVLGVWAGESGENRRFGYREPLVGLLLMAIPAGLLMAGIWAGGRVIKGELAYVKAGKAFAANDGAGVYNNQIEAVKANPYKTNYRVAYSQTNIILAKNLISKENATEEEKQMASQLVQQAIREAKTAASLNPDNVGVWENLAYIYVQLINLAEGADQFAIQSYQQALTRDRMNPMLWLDYGGLLYSLGKFDDAEPAFRQAVGLKGDLANARYNLAKIYEQQQKYAKAAAEMAVVVSLVEPGSADAAKAQSELAELNKKVPQSQQQAAQQGGQEELKAPEALPSRAPGTEEIKLPEEDQPAVAAEISVTPTISPTP